MSEPIINHELFEYDQKEPFKIYVSDTNMISENASRMLNHWHEELEMCFVEKGKATHYINGECVHSETGDFIVTNSRFIHNIIPEPEEAEVKVVVIIVKTEFVRENFVDFDKVYFTNDNKKASEEMKCILDQIIESYCKKDCEYQYILTRSRIIELIYYLCKERAQIKQENINVLANIERIKGVIQYVEKHYQEHISQKEVAKKFYFSSVYFSKYFKKCTGRTFTDYVNMYRLVKAREDLIGSRKSISEIALNNGFSDDRRLIITFKKHFGITPLQYRKEYERESHKQES